MKFWFVQKKFFWLKTRCSLIFPKCLVVLFNYRRPPFWNWTSYIYIYIYTHTHTHIHTYIYIYISCPVVTSLYRVLNNYRTLNSDQEKQITFLGLTVSCRFINNLQPSNFSQLRVSWLKVVDETAWILKVPKSCFYLSENLFICFYINVYIYLYIYIYIYICIYIHLYL